MDAEHEHKSPSPSGDAAADTSDFGAGDAEPDSPPTTGTVSAFMHQAMTALDSYYRELVQRVAEVDDKYKAQESAKKVMSDASSKLRTATDELKGFVTRIREVPVSDIPVVAMTEMLDRAGLAIKSVGSALQTEHHSVVVQETLRGARDRAVAAVHNAFSVARQLPQSVGTRVTQTAQAFDERFGLVGRTGRFVAAVDSRFRVTDRARALDERLGVSERAGAVAQRGYELDQQYLGGAAARAVGATRELTEKGMHYVQAQMAALETRPAALADGSDADAADAADAADGGEGEGEGGMVRSGSAALLTDYARSALGGVRALDEKYGVTRRAGELAVAASSKALELDQRLGVSGRAKALDERFGVSQRAGAAAARAAELDKAYLRGVGCKAVDTTLDLAHKATEYVQAQMHNGTDGEAHAALLDGRSFAEVAATNADEADAAPADASAPERAEEKVAEE